MYIVARRILNKETDNRYYLKLNRESSYLGIYKKTDLKALWDNYPIKQDFDASDYDMYELAKTMPCIFGGDGKIQTAAGVFNIYNVFQIVPNQSYRLLKFWHLTSFGIHHSQGTA